MKSRISVNYTGPDAIRRRDCGLRAPALTGRLNNRWGVDVVGIRLFGKHAIIIVGQWPVRVVAGCNTSTTDSRFDGLSLNSVRKKRTQAAPGTCRASGGAHEARSPEAAAGNLQRSLSSGNVCDQSAGKVTHKTRAWGRPPTVRTELYGLWAESRRTQFRALLLALVLVLVPCRQGRTRTNDGRYARPPTINLHYFASPGAEIAIQTFSHRRMYFVDGRNAARSAAEKR